jgi:hypothetical protein
VFALEEAAALEMLFEGVSDLVAIQTHLKAYLEHMRIDLVKLPSPSKCISYAEAAKRLSGSDS